MNDKKNVKQAKTSQVLKTSCSFRNEENSLLYVNSILISIKCTINIFWGGIFFLSRHTIYGHDLATGRWFMGTPVSSTKKLTATV